MINTHPYQTLADSAYWKRAVAQPAVADVDPIVNFPFRITPKDRIATAGSCFAQHLSSRLQMAGFNYYITEEAPFFLPEAMARQNGYGVFTARYGNLYTPRQLLQLYQRAYGQINAAEDYWTTQTLNDTETTYLDPFRPRIQEGGFATLEEFTADREQHYQAVREAFENLDVFVFTLGLTESWRHRETGLVYPLCPGVAGGTFDPAVYEFVNFEVTEITADMLEFIDLLRAVNPAAKVLLTVSPVPLVATYEPRHVLASTTYSKSVLRVSCEQLMKARDNVAYFPSYEIITGSYSRGRYFGDDLRSVTADGVDHVMRCFMQHCTTQPEQAVQQQKADSSGQSAASVPTPSAHQDHLDGAEQLIETLCEEEMLDADATSSLVKS